MAKEISKTSTKNEIFEAYETLLKKAQEKITKAGEDIDELVGTRTRKIQGSAGIAL